MGEDKPKSEDPLDEWDREMRRELELDLEGLTSDEARQRLLVAAIRILAVGSSVVALLLVRAAVTRS